MIENNDEIFNIQSTYLGECSGCESEVIVKFDRQYAQVRLRDPLRAECPFCGLLISMRLDRAIVNRN